MATEIKNVCDSCGKIDYTAASLYLKNDGKLLPPDWQHVEIKLTIGYGHQTPVEHTHVCDLCPTCVNRLPTVCFPHGWPKQPGAR